VEKRHGVRRIVAHVGSAHDDTEPAVLMASARDRIHAGQQALDLPRRGSAVLWPDSCRGFGDLVGGLASIVLTVPLDGRRADGVIQQASGVLQRVHVNHGHPAGLLASGDGLNVLHARREHPDPRGCSTPATWTWPQRR